MAIISGIALACSGRNEAVMHPISKWYEDLAAKGGLSSSRISPLGTTGNCSSGLLDARGVRGSPEPRRSDSGRMSLLTIEARVMCSTGAISPLPLPSSMRMSKSWRRRRTSFPVEVGIDGLQGLLLPLGDSPDDARQASASCRDQGRLTKAARLPEPRVIPVSRRGGESGRVGLDGIARLRWWMASSARHGGGFKGSACETEGQGMSKHESSCSESHSSRDIGTILKSYVKSLELYFKSYAQVETHDSIWACLSNDGHGAVLEGDT